MNTVHFNITSTYLVEQQDLRIPEQRARNGDTFCHRCVRTSMFISDKAD